MNEERAEHIRQAALTVIDLCRQLQDKEFKPFVGYHGSCSCFSQLLSRAKAGVTGPVAVYAQRMFSHYMADWSTLYGSEKTDYPVPEPKGYKPNGRPEIAAYWTMPKWPSELKPDSSEQEKEYVKSRQTMLCYIERKAYLVSDSLPKNFVQDLGVLHLELKRLQSEGPADGESLGICDLMAERVKSRTINVYPVIRLAAEGWPKHSGDSVYPVPGVDGCPAEAAFGYATDKWTGEYGSLRRELLGWLVDHLMAVDANNHGLDLSYSKE